MSQIVGRISQIIGPVIDVYFDTKGLDAEKVLPKIHEALRIERGNGEQLIIEVQQHIGEDTVRCVAMDNTDGLQRGLEATPLGSPIVTTYLVSEQGIIEKVFQPKEIKTKIHAEQILKWVNER